MENNARRKCVEKKFMATDCDSKDLAVLALSSRSLSSLCIKSSLVAAHPEQIWHAPTCSSVVNIFARPNHICFNFVFSHETAVFWHLQIQVVLNSVGLPPCRLICGSLARALTRALPVSSEPKSPGLPWKRSVTVCSASFTNVLTCRSSGSGLI